MKDGLVEQWRSQGRFERVSGLEVFVRDAGASAAEGVLVLHGFPSSSSDWAHVLPTLCAKRRVLLFDFPGFGLSEKPEAYGYSLFEQADVAVQVARAHGLTRVHVVAHDMGTSVATELLARRERGLLPFELRSLSLLNGSVYLELASLTLSQRLLRSPLGPVFARLSSYRTFRAQLRRIVSASLAEAELEAMWVQLQARDGAKRLPQLIQYLDERTRYAERWHSALRRLDVPTLVVWGRRDPVAVMAIGERLAREVPSAQLVTLETGHYPMLEDPVAVAAALVSFFERVG
jgi:pimeloyl-ACP methyl ester carboxylesterase